MSTTAKQQYETHHDITVKSSNQYTQQVLGCFGFLKKKTITQFSHSQIKEKIHKKLFQRKCHT